MAKKKDNDKYNEPVKVDATGFSFDAFVGAVAGADPKKVQDKLDLIGVWEGLIESNEKVLGLVDEQQAIDRCKAQIVWAKQEIEKLKSGN